MPSFATPEPIIATIEVGAGHLWIRASDRSDTAVEVRPTDDSASADVQAAGETRVDYAHGQLLVKAPRPKLRSLFGRPGSIDVTVELPTGSRVDANGWADIRSEGRLGDATFDTAAGAIRLDETGQLKAHSAAGDVSVARAGGNAEVTTSSGKIRLGEVAGTAVVKTANGDITVGAVTGDARLNTANGDIAVEQALDGVRAKTAYGSVRLGSVARGSVDLQTGFGELEIGIREGTAAWLDVKSSLGSVRSQLEATDQPGPSAETVEVRARTGYGDIVIRRAEPAPVPAPAEEST